MRSRIFDRSPVLNFNLMDSLGCRELTLLVNLSRAGSGLSHVALPASTPVRTTSTSLDL